VHQCVRADEKIGDHVLSRLNTSAALPAGDDLRRAAL
jgi:hypothetical protein